MKKFYAAILAIVVLAVQSSAATLQFDFQRVVTSSDDPQGTGPWATALFEDIAADTVRLTFTHNLSSHADQKITSVYFTVDPGIASITESLVSDSSGRYNGFDYDQDGQNAPLGADFDIEIDLKPQNPGFSPGDVLILELEGSGLNAMSFDFLTAANDIGFTPTMIHLQGIPGGGSAHLDPVPEPATLALLAPLAMAYFRKKKSA